MASVGRRYERWAPLVVVAMLLLLPILTGVAVAKKWPNSDEGLYATMSQIIATLFIAIVVEFLGPDSRVWDDKLDQFMILGQIAFSWLGLFGCIRAMLDGGTALTSGLAAAGVMSASVLVSLALFARVRPATSGSPPFSFVLVFLYPPVLLLILL